MTLSLVLMVLFCKRGRVRGSKRLYPNLQTPVCLGLTRSTHTCKWSNQTYNTYRSAIQHSLISETLRTEIREPWKSSCQKSKTNVSRWWVSVEIWDHVLSAESQNSLNFGGFILIVLVSACCFSFSFGYSSLKPFCNPAVTPAMRIWRAKRWVTKHSRLNLKLETFSCHIYHSQLLTLNKNANFMVTFIKVVFRKADSKRKCL